MHWYCYNDAVNLLNKAKCQIRQSVANSTIFEIHLNFVSLPACRKTWLSYIGVGPQKFHTIEVMAADLRKCCSEDDLSTAP